MQNVSIIAQFMFRLKGKATTGFLIPTMMVILVTACTSPLGKSTGDTLAVIANPPGTPNTGKPLALNESRTYCLGRYLVDVPVEAEWIDEKNSYFFTKIIPMRGDDYYKEMLKIGLDYRTNDPDKIGYFYSQKDSIKGKLPLYISKKNYGNFDLYTIDAFAMPAKESYISFRGKEDTDDSFHNCFDNPCVDSFEREQLNEVVSIYRNNILPSSIMRPNNDVSEIPSKPGFCVGYAFIADADKTSKIPHNEKIRLRFKLKDFHDVEIAISSSYPGYEKKRPLSERQSYLREVKDFPKKAMTLKDKEIERFVSMKRIRSGQLTVNGREGEEFLFILQPDAMPGEAYYFMWEAHSVGEDQSSPRLYFEVFAGQEKYRMLPPPNSYSKFDDLGAWGAQGPSPLAAQDVLRLYETILKTIRIRPMEEGKPGGIAQPRAVKP